MRRQGALSAHQWRLDDSGRICVSRIVQAEVSAGGFVVGRSYVFGGGFVLAGEFALDGLRRQRHQLGDFSSAGGVLGRGFILA